MRLAVAVVVFAAMLVSGPAFADDPLAGVGELLLSGRAAEARTQLTSARAVFVAEGDRSGEAVTDLLLGLAAGALGDASAARSSLDRAASTFLAAGEHFGAWLALTTRAQLETVSGRPREAIALHERALQLLDAAADPGSRFSPRTIEALGLVFGAPPEQLRILAEAPELRKTFVLPLAGGVSRIAYGQALLEAGELQKAEEQLTQAVTKGAMLGGVLEGLLATPMADLRKRQWRFDEARQYYEKALISSGMPTIFMRPSSADIDLLGKLAETDVLTGRVDEGLVWNDRERALALGSEPAREPWIAIERGSLLEKAGRIHEAEKTYREAIAIGQKLGDVHSIGAAHTQLGLLHYYAASYGTSAAEFVKAIEIFQELKEDKGEAVLWTLLADVHLMLDSQVSAAEAIARAKELAKTSRFPMAATLADFLEAALKWRQGEHADMRGAFAAVLAEREANGMRVSDEAKRFMTDIIAMNVGMTPPDPARISGDGVDMLQPMALMMRGVPLAARGDFAGARAIWGKAMELFDSRDVHAAFEGLIATSYWREGNVDDAIRHFRKSTEALESVAKDVRVEEMLTGYLGSERHMFYELLIELLVRDGRVAEAFEETERARARAFLQMIGNRRVGGRGGDPRLVREADIQRRRIAAMEQSIRTTVPGEEATVLKRELVAARQEFEALMVRVKISNPEYAALTTVETVPVAIIQKELPDETTLIDYFVSRNGVHAWVIDRSTLHYVRLPLDATGLRRLTCWARQLSRPEDRADPRGVALNGPCSDAATADEAYTMLIAPLQAKIRHRRLLIVPHRELHYVPFAALHDAKRDRYLIEDYTIFYAPSASAWHFLRRDAPPVSGRALVLGDPAGSMGSLEGAAQEATMVAGRLGTSALLGADACEGLIHVLDPKVDLLHIAAHALYDGANPLFSFIALAAEGEEYDGNLEAHEILADVDLTGINLVVVSACSTAVGKPTSGDEVVGLTRALLYAGTPAVISTLWDIDDVASMALMDAFYERFVSGLPAADALREAQLSMLHGGVFQSPRLWAAFALHGNPQGTWRQVRREIAPALK